MLELRFLTEAELNEDLERLNKQGAISMGDETLTAIVTADEIIVQVNGASHSGLRIAISNT